MLKILATMITNLKHGVKYNISISAINCVGLGESSHTLQLVTGTQNSLINSTVSVNVIVAYMYKLSSLTVC